MVPESYQDGLVFVTPNRIQGLWKEYAHQQVTLEELRERNLNDEEEDEEDNDN